MTELQAELLLKQAARIEKLKAALREIVAGYDWCMENQSNHIMPSVISDAIQDGRAALAPEQDK